MGEAGGRGRKTAGLKGRPKGFVSCLQKGATIFVVFSVVVKIV